MRRSGRWAAVVVVATVLLWPATGLAAEPAPRLDEARAVDLVLSDPHVAAWLERYPPRPATEATYDGKSRRWKVQVWSSRAGQVVEALVDDQSRAVTENWVGPQVAWKMARGRPGAFGGRTINSWPVWVGLSVLFFVGLCGRRLRSLRTLDLLALISFGVSLGFFNHGRVFASSILAVPPLVYLVVRMLAIGLRSAPRAAYVSRWSPMILLAATLFLLGFRVGLNIQQDTVIDVGYAGVIGADRILDGRAPWGAMPQRRGTPCGPVTSEGERRDRIQPSGRCETPNPRGDTYGPVNYIVYLPATAVFGWSGRWDALPAAHATSIGLDALTLLGLVLVGLRFGGRHLAAALIFAWAAFPFTTYALLSNTNDALMPALLVWGFWLASSPWARGGASALAGWAKLASLPTVPLWLTYPDGLTLRGALRFLGGFVVATVVAFAVLLLEPDLLDALRTFWKRTIEFQLGRESPFSVWGWGQYHAEGLPDLALVQRGVQAATFVLAGVVAVLPRRKTPLELAALTAAVLLAVQLSLTHWFYLYLPWVLPFVVLALCLGRPGHASEVDASPVGQEALIGDGTSV